MSAAVPSVPANQLPIVTPLSYDGALALAATVCSIMGSPWASVHNAHHCSLCAKVAALLMAVDVAAREQAWVDRGGPELLSALREEQELLSALREEHGWDDPLHTEAMPACQKCALIAKANDR